MGLTTSFYLINQFKNILMNNIKIISSILLILFLFNNCTILGLGIGNIIDDEKSKFHVTIYEELNSITPGAKLNIISVLGDTIFGEYLNTINKYSSEYILEYNQKYDNLKEHLLIPKINDTLLIANPLGDLYKYIFLGFDYKSIYVKSILAEKNLFLKLDSIMKIKMDSEHYLDQYSINNAIELKLIPIMSRMNIESKNGINSIFFHQINQFQIKSATVKRYLLILGAAIDIYLISTIDKISPGG